MLIEHMFDCQGIIYSKAPRKELCYTCIVQQASKYLLVSGIGIGVVGAVLASLGFLSIDVPEPATWLFFIGVLLLIVSVVLIVVSGVLWAIKRVRSKAF